MCLPRSLLLAALALFPVAAALCAQQPLPFPPVTGDAGPAAPAREPADVRLTFSNSPVADILDQYQLLTGKHVIPDNKVQGNLSFSVNSPVTRSEAIKLIEVLLNLNGYSIVQDDGDIVKVLGLNVQPRQNGVPIFTDVAQVPDSDQIVGYLARLHYLDPLETAGVLQQIVPPAGNGNVAFNPIPKAGALVITDTASHLKQIIALLAQIDLPPAPVVEEFIRLDRADATKAVEFLNSAFELKATGAPGTPASPAAGAANPSLRRPIRRTGDDGQPAAEIPGFPTAPSSGNNDFAIQGRITLTADVRTNRVHVVTSPVNVPRIEQLLHEYDADTPFATPVRRPLKFVSARDVLPILVQALTEPGSEGSNGTSPTGTTGSNNQPRSNGSSANGLFGSQNSNGNSTSSSIGSSGGNSSIGQEGLDTQPVDTTPTEATVGNNKLIADQRNNTIILLGGQEAKDKVFEVLDQLDVRSPQVVIRTVIGELSLNDGKEFGLNYLLRSNRGSVLSNFNASQLPTGATTTDTGVTTDPTTGTTTTTGTGGTSTSGTGSVLNSFSTLATGIAGISSTFSGVGGIISIGKSFDIILSALESTSRFKTISRPMIFTSNNKKAIIASGQEIAVPTQSLSTSTGTTLGTAGISTNVDYKDVTLQLEVVPLINSDHEITLDILQKIDNIVAGSSTTVGGNAIPTIATRYLKSTVSAPNNSTIVLGGLITEDDNVTNSAIPYLSKIPLIGKLLFTTHTRNADRSELIILMHPEVVNTDTLVKNVLPNEENRTYLGHDLENQLLPLEVRKAIPVTQPPTPTPLARRSRASSSK